MATSYREVSADDFSKITTDPLPHQEIERAIIHIGGGGVAGIQYKTEVLTKAGWSTDKLRTYISKPDQAAEIFNRIRLVLEQTEDKNELLARLSG
jgi:hypothetical protein